MFYFNCFTCLTIFALVFNAYCYTDYEGWFNIRLEHSFSNLPDAQFTVRGNASVHDGATSVTNLALSVEEKNKLQVLAREDKFYRLRAVVENSDGTETTFLSSIKACMLVQSNLNDYLSMTLDHSNNVVGISIGVQKSVPCQGADVGLEKLSKFNTKIYVMPISVGPIPDTASYIQKLEREREAKERGDVKDNRSFLAKYWMYIVPVVIIMVLSSAANPDGAGGGGGGRQ